MYKKLIWGLGVLSLLIATAFVLMTVRNLAEIRHLKEEAAVAEKPLEDDNKQKPVAEVDEQPPAEEGFKWVWHNDHWDKVPVVDSSEPIEPSPTPFAENAQATQYPDLSADEGKPLNEDFFRDNYSREQLESMIKSDKSSIEQYTVLIPQYEEYRKKALDMLQLVSDAPESAKKYHKDRLAVIEATLNRYKRGKKITERHIAIMSNVLNEEEPNNEK